MAIEKITAFVCDLDGDIAVRSVTFGVNGDRLQLDLCEKHFTEFMEKSHAPRRGRLPRGISGMGVPNTSSTSRGRVPRQAQTGQTGQRKSRQKRKRKQRTTAAEAAA